MLKDSRVPLAWERVTDVWSALLDNPDACADDRNVRTAAVLLVVWWFVGVVWWFVGVVWWFVGVVWWFVGVVGWLLGWLGGL